MLVYLLLSAKLSNVQYQEIVTLEKWFEIWWISFAYFHSFFFFLYQLGVIGRLNKEPVVGVDLNQLYDFYLGKEK